ncbi:hypothetical protein MJO28_009727 [Puccinia striiformis f. sp. tritici]|uniref:Uncharacterized protein n=1 Tax=Puccinia striiformis f. sp. tritici TaxID=168172 RepID=A0ACC0E825_9BASI|nr:hypothetical protein MJO28_009727 [Puccinia striiformis f. sp. tritici]
MEGVADLFLTTSRSFLLNDRDSLNFSGTLTGRTGPFFRACPNTAPLALSRMRGQGMAQRDGTFRSLPVNVTLAHPYRFDILPGRSYALSGHISKLDDGRTIIMQVNYDNNHRPLPGGEQVELGPMMITGNGKITRVRYINSMNVENPTLKLVVSHDPAGNGDGRVKVRWLLAMGAMDIPHDTNFVVGTRISLAGRLEDLGEPAGLVVVKAIRGVYYEESKLL